MITIKIAGVNVGIENQYDFTKRVEGWQTEEAPAFTVRVSPEDMIREDEGRGFAPDYLEFICAYRHIAERMPDYDAFVCHGVAVTMHGLSYLFSAPSGVGKSTHALFWLNHLDPTASILNGDKPIIHKMPEGFEICGTPWRGKENYGFPVSHPLKGICMLHRGAEDRITPAQPEELIRFILRQVYIPQDPARADRMLTLLDECCRTVPVWSMYCTLDPNSARVSFEAMRPKDKAPQPAPGN